MEFKKSVNEIQDNETGTLLTGEDSTITEKLFDFDIDEDIRISYLNKLGQDPLENANIFEIIARFNAMYLFARLISSRNFLRKICLESTIPTIYKFEAVKCLCNMEKSEEHYNILHSLLSSLFNKDLPDSDTIAVPCRLEYIHLLCIEPKFRKQALDFLVCIINDDHLDIEYRYKSILSLELIENLEPEVLTESISYVALEFLKWENNAITYKIFSLSVFITPIR